jgi:hypothetical protein
MDFPTLYGSATNGKVKEWSIRVIETGGIFIETRHGYEGGKIQTNLKEITQGKNIGRKNATTPLQQAISDAQSLWQKKRDEKYDVKASISATSATSATSEATSAISASRAAEVDDSVPSPMLAHDYNKRGKSIVYPCYVQPKLDGTRTIAIPGKGLFSRNRKAYPHLEHIREEIDKLPHIILDGELYSDTLTFQEIVGLVKNETLQEKQTEIKLHVYDMINDQTFHVRNFNLQMLFKKHKFKHLVLVKTEGCASEDVMKEKHAEYVQEGFEGVMLRNKEGGYANNRSVHLQKYKEFFDMECPIIGFKEGEGLEKGCVIWICKVNEKPFSCRPRGTREQRQEQFLVGEQALGKMLTVRYQEMTDDGLLRFPVGIAIRDYE